MHVDLNTTSANLGINTVPRFRPEMAFPCLTDDMLLRLRGYGQQQAFPAGTALWTRGERDVDMFVVFDGSVQISAPGQNGELEALSTLHPRQFSGELDLLSSRRALVDGRTLSECFLLRIPRSHLQRRLRSEGDIANLIMQATIWRRLGIVERSATGIVLLGRSSSAETIQLQRFLIRNSYPHRVLEPTPDQQACSEMELEPDQYLLPAVILPDGRVLHQPTLADVADEVRLVRGNRL